MNLYQWFLTKKVSSSRFQVDLQESHFLILNSTSSRLRQVKLTPLDLRSSSRPKSTYWGRLPGLVTFVILNEIKLLYLQSFSCINCKLHAKAIGKAVTQGQTVQKGESNPPSGGST